MPNSDINEMKRLYLNAILQGDSEKARQVIDASIARNYDFKDIYFKIICASQEEVGARWKSGELSVADEHLASNVTKDQLAHMRELIAPKSKHLKKVVVTTLAGDEHDLPSRILADFFLMDGWDVHYLGANTPVKDLVSFVKTREPHVLCISVTSSGLEESVSETVAALKDFAKNFTIVIGGKAALELQKNSELCSLVCSGNAEEAVSCARKRIGMLDVCESLDDILENIAHAIKVDRKAKKISQKHLAERAGLDRAYMNSIEQGKKNLTLGSLLKISGALGISLGDLMRQAKLG